MNCAWTLALRDCIWTALVSNVHCMQQCLDLMCTKQSSWPTWLVNVGVKELECLKWTGHRVLPGSSYQSWVADPVNLLMAEWTQIPTATHQNLVASLPRRVEGVLEGKRDYIWFGMFNKHVNVMVWCTILFVYCIVACFQWGEKKQAIQLVRNYFQNLKRESKNLFSMMLSQYSLETNCKKCTQDY